MPEEVKPQDAISPEIQEVMRNLVAAIRAVKIYPTNNPIFSQSIRKAFGSLERFLRTEQRFPVGIQKTFLLFSDIPVAKDTQINRAIAQDLFTKGFREMVFLAGVTEAELTDFLLALALLPEEMAMRSGIVSILWEKDVAHIKVTEATLEEVITGPADRKRVRTGEDREKHVPVDQAVAKKDMQIAGRMLVLGDVVEDPRGFGMKMIEIAGQTASEGQAIEDRLHELYQEAGRHILQESPQDQEGLFKGMARSVLEMDPALRDKFVSSRLYAHLDAQNMAEQDLDAGEHIPHDLHEIVTGRFSQEWSVPQVAALLKGSSAAQQKPKEKPIHPSQLTAEPISQEAGDMAREMTEYTPDEMEILRSFGEVGTESDIMEASVRTLIFLLSLVRGPVKGESGDKELAQFSGVVHQLETTLLYLLANKEYDLATIIIRALHLPVDDAFRPRLAEAIKKASAREVIKEVLNDMRANRKDSPGYVNAYAYLSALDQEATTVLLETLAVEKDRAIRRYLIDILKELGRNQIGMIAQRMNDSRWYVVRNIVNILGESRSEEAVTYLERAAGHVQPQIRHEVIKGLLNIGGRKAAGLLCRFLQDKDAEIQMQAVRGLGVISGAGAGEARELEAYLQGRSLKRQELELSIEGIRTLGKISDPGSETFLARYLKLRWWRSRRPQEELRDAATGVIDALRRRQGNVG